jgi:hypothetical protein
LSGHPQGAQVAINGAAMVGAALSVTDFVTTGSTAAAISADYAANKAMLEARYTTIVESASAVASSGNVGIYAHPRQSYLWNDILFRGNQTFYGSSNSSTAFLTDCSIDSTNAISGGVTTARMGYLSTANLCVITNSQKSEVINSGGVTSHTGLQVRVGGAVDCRGGTYSGSLTLCASALVYNFFLDAFARAFIPVGLAGCTIKNAGPYNVNIEAGSSIVFRGNNPAPGTLTIENALSGVRMDGGSNYSTDTQDTAYTLVLRNHTSRSIQVDHSFFSDRSVGAGSINNSPVGVYAATSNVRLPLNLTFVGVTTQVSAVDSSDVEINSNAVTTTSPPVGVIGNNNSLIHT